MNIIQIKNFCSSKDTYMKIKIHATEWEKIFAKHESDKGLVTNIYEEPSNFNKKINNPIKT